MKICSTCGKQLDYKEKLCNSCKDQTDNNSNYSEIEIKYKLAIVYLKQQKYEYAFETFRKVLKLNQNYKDTNELMEQAHQAMKQVTIEVI